MELHIEASGLIGDRLFINDKHGVTVAEVQVLARDAAPFIIGAVNARQPPLHAEMLQLLLDSRGGISFDWKQRRDGLLMSLAL